MVEGINAGADDYIAKSSDLEVLRARVRAQLRRKQFEDENRSIREQLLQKELEVAAANSARELAETRSIFVEELQRKNRELESFSYTVSHDLRAPLRSIYSFSQILLEDYSEKLDSTGKSHLERVSSSAKRMGELIDDLLELSRVARADLSWDRVDLSAIARTILESFSRNEPERRVEWNVQDDLVLDVDGRLMKAALENLLGNALKFTAKMATARIEFGAEQREGGTVYFVRDNGAGFDMKHADKLFSPFKRLHGNDDFPGSGIGLATVHRIVDRHGGRIWAESSVGEGATFYFTISTARPGIPS
jgi:light-regulated signal transduction histidine kinase (bacteriophytochrome)